MKNVMVLAIALFITFFSNQMFAQVKKWNYPPDEFKNCQFKYDDLTFEGGSEKGPKTHFYQKKKYTGYAIKYVNTTIEYFAFKFDDGKIEHVITAYENGFLERDFRFKDGIPYGTHRMWFEDGSKYIEETYHDGKPLKFLRWYNNGQLAREANFKNGKLVNEFLYKRDGTLKSKN